MASMFVSDNTNRSSPPKGPEPTRPKRPRPSLACIRCRKKKVKCDFVQPTCGRCASAGLPCSYATPPRRVDGQAFDQLGNHVEELKERMQKMQSELALIKNNLHPFPASGAGDGSNAFSSPAGASAGLLMDEDNISGGNLALMDQHTLVGQETDDSMAGGALQQQPVTWKLSLSPSGLRIDTNIASVADLYRILLNGISQLNINTDSATNLFSTDSIRSSNNSSSGDKPRQHKAWGRYAAATMQQKETPLGGDGSGNDIAVQQQRGGRLWEVDESEARKILQERKAADETIPQGILDQLMGTCYHRCFLAYQIVDRNAFLIEYQSGMGMNPLLANSINAWVAKHGCIYHGVCPDRDPLTIGEVYFKNARQLLKKCFDISNATTVHALLNLYMYQLSSERSSLAYLYIGLAIRMAQDLKFHKKEHMPADPKQRETCKRLWWSTYWLDLCAALESNRPTMVDDKDCDLEYPTRLETEDDETGFRIDFCVHSIKLMKIRKDIAKNLPSEQSGQSLLSAISRLENALTHWLEELPKYFRFEPEDVFKKTNSFRDEALMILNIQYQTTWIMLHKFFLPKQNQTATPVALLSLNICTKAANFITKMLSLYAAHLCWCQFFYALDGIIASVSIHQSNSLTHEKEVACLAQRNLIITANVLRGSPLVYMDKVNEIIDSIDSFLKENQLPIHLNELPSVNEDLVNQQSIYSVFHPNMFDNTNSNKQQQQQHSAMTSPLPAPLGQQHHQQYQRQAVSPPSMMTGDHFGASSGIHTSLSTSPMAAPAASVTSSPHPSIIPPPQMIPSPQLSLRDNNNNNDNNSHQQSPMAMGFAPQQPQSLAGDSMMFSNAAALMGFNESANQTVGGGNGAGMDPMMFRDLSLMDPHQSADMFASLGQQGLMGGGDPQNYVSAPPPLPVPSSSSSSTCHPSAGYAYATGDIYQHPSPQQRSVPSTYMSEQQGGVNPLFGGSDGSSSSGGGAGNPFGLAFGGDNGGGGGYDPAQLFGAAGTQNHADGGLDPAAMNALLYATNGGDVLFQQPPAAQQQQQQQFAAMYAAAVASRKRVHREWDGSV